MPIGLIFSCLASGDINIVNLVELHLSKGTALSTIWFRSIIPIERNLKKKKNIQVDLILLALIV